MDLIDKKAIIKRESIDIKFFFENFRSRYNLELISENSGFSRLIKDQNLHRPGLALAGFVDLFSYARVQIFGNTEMRYLKQLTAEDRRKTLSVIFEFAIPCIILTNGNKPFPEMLELANKAHIPIFGSPLSTTQLTYFIGDFLDDQFATRCSVHASFVDVYGVGIMFVGKPGIGKSEVALDLVERGHRLVTDDVVIITKKGEGILMGAGTDTNKHFLEIRGIGPINIAKMFGVRAVRYQKRLEVIVELETSNDESDYNRSGLTELTMQILDVEIPHVKLPIIPGKNITVISEVISLHYLLKHYGYDAAKDIQEVMMKKMQSESKSIERGVAHFEHDFE